MSMNRTAVARELVKLAKEMLGAEWESPRGERKNWRREKPDGTYEYREEPPEGNEPAKEAPAEKQLPHHRNMFTPRDESAKKVKSIGGMSPQDYAGLWGGTNGQGSAHFYNYSSEHQTKDEKFYDEFINGKGGIKEVIADVKKKPDSYEKKDLGELTALLGHVEAERRELKGKKGPAKE